MADDAGKSEEMLKGLGIAVRDASGNFRQFDDILEDVNVRWDSLTNVQQTALAQQIGGTHHYSKFLSLMENYGMATDAATTALDSQDSALIENEKALDSVSGKWNQLVASVESIKLSFMDSEELKILLDFGIALANVAEKAGGFKLAVSGVTLLMISQSKGVKEFCSLFDNFGDLWGYGVSEAKLMINKLKSFGTSIVNNTASLKLFKRETQGVSTANISAATTTTVHDVAVKKLTFDVIAAKVALLGLKVAASFGFALLIEGAITLATKLFNAKKELVEFNDELREGAKNNSESITSAEKLLERQEEITQKMSETTGLEEQVKLKDELLDIQKELAEVLPNSASGLTEEGDAISKNTEKVKENIEALKEENAVKAASFFNKNKNIDDSLNSYESTKDTYDTQYEAMKLNKKWAKKKLTGVDEKGNGIWGVEYVTVTPEMVEKSKENLDAIQKDVNDSINYYKAFKDAGYTDSAIENIMGKEVVDLVKEFTKELDKNTDAKNKNSNTSIDLSGSGAMTAEEAAQQTKNDATKLYSEALGKAEELKGIIDGINEAQGLTPDLVKQVIDTYPELGDKIGNAEDLQNALNEKIKEQVDIQSEAYQIMMGDDAAYYSARLANGNEMQDAFSSLASFFVDTNSDAYNFDVNNYATLNEAKSAFMTSYGGAIADFVSQFVDINKEAYAKDLENCQSLAEAKARIINTMSAQLGVLQDNMNEMANTFHEVAVDSKGNALYGRTAGALEYYNELANQLKVTQVAFDKVNESFDGYGASFSGYTPSFTGSTGGSSGGSGSDSGSDPEADAQAERERLEEEANNTIENLRTQLINALKKKYEELRTKELEPLDKEIEMKQKQLDKLRNGNMDEAQKLAAMKKELGLWQQNDSTLARQKV